MSSKHHIANYSDHRSHMLSLIENPCNCGVTLVEGPENYGKTWLLEDFIQNIPKDIKRIIINLAARNIQHSPFTILHEVQLTFDARLFPSLSQKIETMNISKVAIIENVQVYGNSNSVIASTGETEDDRLFAAARLTTAFISDLENLPDSHTRPLVIAFDSYDRATPLVQAWIERVFLRSIAEVKHVRVIICSRDFGSTAIKSEKTLKLLGVKDPAEWLSLVRALEAKLPIDNNKDDPIAYMKGVVDITPGVPGTIMPWLSQLVEA